MRSESINAFSAVLSTEGRVVGPCWEHLKPEGPKGHAVEHRRDATLREQLNVDEDNSTLEVTQGQILSQSPTYATQRWWHLYGG